MSLIPKNWLDNADMKRIILHWTAGPSGYRASSNDKSHYHFLIEGDSTVVRGRRVIVNESTSDGSYAAHTRGLNGQSIGVSVCAMHGAHENPNSADGSFPMKKSQWESMAQLTAELCQHYNIPIKRRTVLAHGEVQSILGIKQSGKWDPLRFPWSPNTSKSDAGNLFRDRVRHYFAGGISAENYTSYSVEAGETLWSIAHKLLGSGERWVELKDSNKNPVEERNATNLSAGDVILVPTGAAGNSVSFDSYTVQNGETLWSIAFFKLGSGSRWRDLRDIENKSFSEEDSSNISEGTIILVPKI